jgi:hypothetical protein
VEVFEIGHREHMYDALVESYSPHNGYEGGLLSILFVLMCPTWVIFAMLVFNSCLWVMTI